MKAIMEKAEAEAREKIRKENAEKARIQAEKDAVIANEKAKI